MSQEPSSYAKQVLKGLHHVKFIKEWQDEGSKRYFVEVEVKSKLHGKLPVVWSFVNKEVIVQQKQSTSESRFPRVLRFPRHFRFPRFAHDTESARDLPGLEKGGKKKQTQKLS